MAGPQAVSLTGDDYIDALLTGYKWDTTNLSYSFPDSGIWYLLESIVDDLDPFDIIDIALAIAENPATSLVNLLEELILGPSETPLSFHSLLLMTSANLPPASRRPPRRRTPISKHSRC